MDWTVARRAPRPWGSQARILERVATAFFGALPDPGIEPASPAWQVCRLRSPWEVLGGHHPPAESGLDRGCGGLRLARWSPPSLGLLTKYGASFPMRLCAPPGDFRDTSETLQGIWGGAVKPASPLPPAELHLHLLFTLRLNTRLHFQNQASCQERKRKGRGREQEKEREARLASRNCTRAHERSFLKKKEEDGVPPSFPR